jgi:hypothetical protein
MIKEQAIQLFKALGFEIIEDAYCPPNAFYFVNKIMYERWKLNLEDSKPDITCILKNIC